MIVLVMGVCASGKTTIGQLLARRLGGGFVDADDLHGAHSKAKMAQGIALTDADREPWLQATHAAMLERQRQGGDHVFACSALKRGYRQLLRANVADLRLVYLHGPAELLAERVAQRRGHFFAPRLLADQLATLEAPSAEEALIVDISEAPAQIVERIVQGLAGREAAGGRTAGDS